MHRKFCSMTLAKSSQCIGLPAFKIWKKSAAKNDEKYPLCGIAKIHIKPAFDGCGTSIF